MKISQQRLAQIWDHRRNFSSYPSTGWMIQAFLVCALIGLIF
jgi:hypothetical protein